MGLEYDIVWFENQRAWRSWLSLNHGRTPGVWMRLAKKNSGVVSVSRMEAVEEALCWGWIDGQGKSADADTWLQKFTPRRNRSVWSKINCDKVALLIEANRMQPAGLLEVEQARADGRWERAYEPSSTIEIPEDFAKLLAANPQAEAFFRALKSAERYSVLYGLQMAKKPETSAARMEKFLLSAESMGPIRTLHRKT